MYEVCMSAHAVGGQSSLAVRAWVRGLARRGRLGAGPRAGRSGMILWDVSTGALRDAVLAQLAALPKGGRAVGGLAGGLGAR